MNREQVRRVFREGSSMVHVENIRAFDTRGAGVMSLWAFLICVCNEAGGPSKENKVVKRTKTLVGPSDLLCL